MLAAALVLAAAGRAAVIPSHAPRAHPRGYWRVVAQELRNYCECRGKEAGLDQGDAAAVGLSGALYKPASCRVDRDALLAHARAPAKLTVVVMAYIPEQWKRLDKLVCAYGRSAMVKKVLVLWNGPHADVPNATCASDWRETQPGFHSAVMRPWSRGAPAGAAAEDVLLEVVVEKKNTLLNRYRHAKRVATESVVLQDDDVFHHRATLDAFSWARLAAPDQILGTPPERHYRRDEKTGLFAYVFHPLKTESKQYSFLLGQTSVLRRETIDHFVREAPRAALAYIISHKPTCEDLTLHFFNGNATRLPPLVFADLKPTMIQGRKQDNMHRDVGKRLWNARRERCLNRLANEFRGMSLVPSRCRVRGNITRLLEREASGDRRLWKYLGPRRDIDADDIALDVDAPPEEADPDWLVEAD